MKSIMFDTRRSLGSYLVDANSGRKWVDMYSFYGSCPIGHNHPKMVEFRHELASIAIHNPSNSDVQTVEKNKFVETFRKTLPEDFKDLFFISGGALAVENALKVAFDWKTRLNLSRGFDTVGSKVIHFREAFHGRSGYTLSMTNTDIAKTQYFPKFDWPRIINPKILCNTESLEVEAHAQISQAIATHGRDIAALIIEPIQGEGGDNHFRPTFWQQLRKTCDQEDIMFIADEVQSGMGLTGRWWAWEHMGAAPDIIAFGKKSQVCGIACGPRVNTVPDNVFKVASRINSTWGGNLTDMMRSRKYLEIIEEEGLLQNADRMGQYMLQQLTTCPGISNRRGRGLMIAFDLDDAAMADRVRDLAFDRGLLILRCGEKSIRFRPMLDITKQSIDEAISILQEVLTSLRA